VDNQTAIRALVTLDCGPSHYLLDAFHDELTTFHRRNPHAQVTVHWIPGHTGVRGNEEADGEAKRAADGNVSNRKDLPKILQRELPASRTSTLKAFRKELHDRHDKMFTTSARYSSFHSITRATATKSSREFRRLAYGLPKKLTSILVQLRTGHIGLNKHLFRIGKTTSPLCPCCGRHPETVMHFVLQCPAHRMARERMLKLLGRRQTTLHELLTDRKALKPLFRYVRDTGRLKTTFGEIPDPPAEEDA